MARSTNHLSAGKLLEVEMSKKCRLLWRGARLQFTTFGRSGVISCGSARDCASCHTSANREGFHGSFSYNHCYATYTTRHDTPLHNSYIYNYSSLHCTTLATLHCATQLHYTPLLSTTLHYTRLGYITLHYTALRYATGATTSTTTLHFTTLTALH